MRDDKALFGLRPLSFGTGSGSDPCSSRFKAGLSFTSVKLELKAMFAWSWLLG